MNKIQYEQENNTRYMKMEFSNITEEAEYEMKMLMNNKINIFLPISIKTINNKNIYFYNITSKQQFCKIYEFNKLQMKDIEMVLNSLEVMAQIVNNYMLNLDSVRVTPDMLFFDLTNKKLMFAYIPMGKEEDFQSQSELQFESEMESNLKVNAGKSFDKDLKELFDFIIEHFNHESDKKSVVKIYSIYQKIIQHEYNIVKMSDLLYEQEEEMVQQEPMNFEDEGEEKIIKEIPQEVIEDEVEKKNKSLVNTISMIKMVCAILFVVNAAKILAPDIIPLPYGGIVPVVVCVCLMILLLILFKIPEYAFIKVEKRTAEQPFTVSQNIKNNTNNSDSVQMDDEIVEHTILLSDYFEKKKNNKNIKLTYCGEDGLEDIFIEKLPCVVGSKTQDCNYVIDSKIVSHIHMCILKIENAYYIEDMNSTNGTYLNGERLAANERKEVKKDDVILLATLPYKVEMIG